MSTVAVCDGQIDASTLVCSAGVYRIVDASGIPGAFDLQQLDVAVLASYFMGGFGVVVGLGLVAFAGYLIIKPLFTT